MTEQLTRRTPAAHRASAGSSPVPGSAPQRGPLQASLWKLGNAVVDRGVRATLSAVDRLSAKLEEVTRHGGPLPAAAGGGVAALVTGKNPIWGAVGGLVRGTSTTTRVLVVLAVVVALVLGPVVLVLLLLALVVVAVVAAVRSGAGA